MKELLGFLASHTTGELILIIGISFLLSLVLQRLHKRFTKSKAKNPWLSTFARAVYPPMLALIWSLALVNSFEAIISDPLLGPFIRAEELNKEFWILGLKKLAAVTTLAMALLRWKKGLEKAFIEKNILSDLNKDVDQALFGAISRLISIFIAVVFILMALDIMGVPIQTLVAIGGIGSLAISLAGQAVIANFFGGLMIYINRPFTVGNWIKSPNKHFEGVVEQIGWYMTQIRTLERRPMYVPNALITDAIIENPGRMYNRRIKTNVGIRYQDIDQVEIIAKEMQEMVRAHPGIDTDLLTLVNFTAFGNFSLDLNIYCFTKTTSWAEFRIVQQEIFLKTAEIIKKHGAEMAFPTQTLHVYNETHEV